MSIEPVSVVAIANMMIEFAKNSNSSIIPVPKRMIKFFAMDLSGVQPAQDCGIGTKMPLLISSK